MLIYDLADRLWSGEHDLRARRAVTLGVDGLLIPVCEGEQGLRGPDGRALSQWLVQWHGRTQLLLDYPPGCASSLVALLQAYGATRDITCLSRSLRALHSVRSSLPSAAIYWQPPRVSRRWPRADPRPNAVVVSGDRAAAVWSDRGYDVLCRQRLATPNGHGLITATPMRALRTRG